MMNRRDARENIFALKLMQSVFSQSQSFSAQILEYSMQHQMYHRIVRSFCWNAEIPFTICFAMVSSKLTKSKNPIQGYCGPDDAKLQKLIASIKKSEASSGYNAQLGEEIFDVVMRDIASEIRGDEEGGLESVFDSELSLCIWQRSQSVQESFSDLVKAAWNESAKALTEVLVTVDVEPNLETKGSFVCVDGLLNDAVDDYYHAFSALRDESTDLIGRLSESIEMVNGIEHTGMFPPDLCRPRIASTIKHLEKMRQAVTQFNTHLQAGSSGVIRLYDCSLDGFLENPMPPL